jgi:SAM-dependent methyltransferase
MPVDASHRSEQPLSQRRQYAKGGLGRWYWDWRDRLTLSYLDDRDRRILDLGCGEGITLERLLARFPGQEILGLDIMPENVDICKSHGLPARLGDLYHLDLPSGSQDAVVFLEVIEHLDRPERALQEIHRVLRPGGKLLIMFPNDLTFLLARLLTLRFKESFYDPGRLKQWTPALMQRALTEQGFRVAARRQLPFYFWPLSLHCLLVGLKTA